MQIFVAYGYNERDKWIPTLVFPIIKAFGVEVVTGDETWGGAITAEVMNRIDDSDGLIGFTTRRGRKRPDGTFDTHRWVTDEIAYALRRSRPVLEVSETGVDEQRGMAGDLQRIVYDERSREKTLVDLVKVMGLWCRGKDEDVHLLPDDLVREIRPMLSKPGFQCRYTVMRQRDGRQEERAAKVIPTRGGLLVKVLRVPIDSLIQIRVQAEGRSWASEFVPLNSRNVQLDRE